jgi:uncharacterized membrane protein (DUF106 family)
MSDAVFNAVAVFGVSFLMSFAMILIRRRFTNQEQLAQMTEEIKRWNTDKEKAKKTGDKKLTAKLRKQEKRISQLQSKMLKGQLISVITTFALYFGIWPILTYYLGNSIVAYIPFSVPFVEAQPPYALPFLNSGIPVWYFICSYFSNSMLQRIFGMSMGLTMQPQK